MISEFGDKGITIFDKQGEILNELISNIKDKSKNQRKVLIQTILPRIALYKAFLKCDYSLEDTFLYMQKYMTDIVGFKKHLSMEKMEFVPCFFSIYKWAFLKTVSKSDLWESEQKSGEGYFDVNMKKCLWHTACAENDCPELCPLFCDVDNVTYGNLKKLGFERTKTLGYGDEVCDFHFYKK